MRYGQSNRNCPSSATADHNSRRLLGTSFSRSYDRLASTIRLPYTETRLASNNIGVVLVYLMFHDKRDKEGNLVPYCVDRHGLFHACQGAPICPAGLHVPGQCSALRLHEDLRRCACTAGGPPPRFRDQPNFLQSPRRLLRVLARYSERVAQFLVPAARRSDWVVGFDMDRRRGDPARPFRAEYVIRFRSSTADVPPPRARHDPLLFERCGACATHLRFGQPIEPLPTASSLTAHHPPHRSPCL